MSRSIKIMVWGVGAVSLLVVLLGIVLIVAGNTDSGRAMIQRLTYRLTSGHVSLSGLAGAFPGHVSVARLQLSDGGGVWLTADRVAVDWTPLALLARRLQIDALHAAAVDMRRLPQSSSAAPPKPVSIPRIDVATAAVDRLELGAPLAGTPATLVLRGNAHLRSLSDMLIHASAQRINGEGRYELQLDFDSRRMDAALTLHEPAGGPLENLLGLPGLGALAARLNLHGPHAAERFDLAVDAGAARGRAQGIFNMTGLSADLDFSFDSPALLPRPGLGWQRASAHGRWHGSIKAPTADIHVEAAQLRLPGDTLLATVSADLTAASGAAALHALVGGLRIPGPQPQLLEDSAVKIDAAMRLDQAERPVDLWASSRLFSLHAAATAAPDKLGGTVDLRLPDLRELAALGGQDVRGSALIKARLRKDGDTLRADVGASAALGAGRQFWAAAVGNRPTLQFAGALTGKAVVIESLKFAGRAASVSASGEISRHGTPAVRARWDFNAADLGALSPALAGTLKASGTLDGPFKALAATARLSSTLSVRGSPSGTVAADVSLRGLPSQPSGSVVAQGVLDAAPVQVNVAVERGRAGSVHAIIHRAEWKSGRAEGDINLGLAGGGSNGELHLQMAQLADLQRLLGTPIAGSLAADLELRPKQGQTQVSLHAQARDLSNGTLAANVQLSAEGGADAVGFKLDVQVPHLRGEAASASAGGSLNLDAATLSVASASANYRGQSARLLSPARIDFGRGLHIDEIKLGAQQAVLDIGGAVAPALDLRASLRGVQPALIDAFAPGLLESGSIEADAQLQGSLTAPRGQVRVAAKGLRPADNAAFGLPPVNLRATLHLNGDSADVDAGLEAGSASRLDVVGRAPLAAGGALDLKISGRLDVGLINPLLEARGEHAAGDLLVDATVDGSIDSPQIGGTIDLTKGSMRDYVRGLSLTDISAAIVGSQGALSIKRFSAAAAPGSVSMTGTVGVLQRGIPVDLNIVADNAQPVVSKLVTANFSADLHVKGAARERLDITGTVDLHRTLIGIPNSLPPNVAVLDVRRRGKAAPAVPDKPLIVGLDVRVRAPQQILVQGRGLDAEVGGNLRIAGTTDEPRVSGRFDLQRGSFSIAGNKLNFTPPGGVSFNGAGLKNKIDPTLDFTAQTTMQDGSGTVTATLRITGPADAPQFEFTSTPTLPQDEIMARLLFGRPAQQLSGLQLAQTGAALATLSGVGGDGSLNPLAKLQKSLGLDRLTVGAATTNTATGTENSGASIEAGRYISKRVYIVAKQTTTGTSQLEADVELTKHLKLQTRLGNGTASVLGTTPENDPGSSVGLTYQIEY